MSKFVFVFVIFKCQVKFVVSFYYCFIFGVCFWIFLVFILVVYIYWDVLLKFFGVCYLFVVNLVIVVDKLYYFFGFFFSKVFWRQICYLGKSFVFEVWGYNYGICVISYGLVKKIMIVFMVICIWWSFNGGKNLNLVVVCFL